MLLYLSNNLNDFRGKAQVQCFNKLQESIYKLQDEINIENQKNEQLQVQ